MTDTLDDPLAWLAAQAASPDPVHHRVLEGLARRAGALPAGPLRERLVARLQQRAAAAPPANPRQTPVTRPSPLAALLATLQAAGPELRHVQAHEGTWRTLRVARRLAEVSAPVPEHLGPLNSQVLVARALQQLGDLAPAYLQRLLAELDTLAALAPLQGPADAEKPARGSKLAKPARPVARKAPARPR